MFDIGTSEALVVLVAVVILLGAGRTGPIAG
jgi:Sec-independent protein translocase protein TatA